jgi:hypothetical protein
MELLPEPQCPPAGIGAATPGDGRRNSEKDAQNMVGKHRSPENKDAIL